MAEAPAAVEARGAEERSPDRDRSPSRSSQQLPRDDRGRTHHHNTTPSKAEKKRGESGSARRHSDEPPHGEKRERERDRDNKRKKSSSPPYPDRRYASPRRSPSHKRYAYSHPNDKSPFDHGRGFRRQGGSRHQELSKYFRGGYDNYSSHGDYPTESRRDGDVLLSYKQFILDLDDDVSPADAQKRYEEYKNEFMKAKRMTYFNQHKDEDGFREKYDPILLDQYIVKRNKAAQASAADIMEKLKNLDLDINPETNHDPEDSKEGEDAKRRKPFDRKLKNTDSAPKVPSNTKHARVRKDIDQCISLIKKMDKEKDIANNLLLEREIETITEGKEENSETLSIVIEGNQGSKRYSGVEFLDILLTYLWRVHGVDYYGGIELKEIPKGYRHIRDESDSSEESASSEWERKVDNYCERRLKEGDEGEDPLVSRMEKKKVDAAVGQTLDGWVKKIHDEKYTWKYGCGVKGCGKVFHGPEFVIKHLNLKHPDLVKEITVKVTREIFVTNFLNDDSFSISDILPSTQSTLLDRPPKKRGYEYRGDSLDDKELNDKDFPRADKSFSDFDRFERPGPEGSGYDRRPLHDFPENGRFQAKISETEVSGRFGGEGRFGLSGDRFDLDRRDGGRFEEGRQIFPPGPNIPAQPPQFRHDPSMFEPFEGPHLRPRRFDHPIPPPMLIPVPGAGPLGPFVPAPPDVAIRMIRNRGPRPPIPPFFDTFEDRFEGKFEGAGGDSRLSMPHGDFIKPGRIFGPGTGSREPGNAAPPQGMYQDPRGMRSYHDLDAPDDEIQVIDYRSV